jgi:hypothetical protein
MLRPVAELDADVRKLFEELIANLLRYPPLRHPDG